MSRPVYDYLPFIRDRGIYFAVKKAITDIEKGKDMYESISYHAASEGKDPATVRQFIVRAYADKRREEARAKYKYYLIEWCLPGGRTQWCVQRAKSAAKAKTNLFKRTQNQCVILHIKECETKKEADVRLLFAMKEKD